MSIKEKTLDELRAEAEASAKALAAAEYAEAHPPLSLEEADAALDAAEARLAIVEGPFWDLEHAKVNLNAVTNEALTVKEYLKATAEAEIPKAQARLLSAQKAFDAAGFTQSDMDIAAQAVLDARAAVAQAEEA